MRLDDLAGGRQAQAAPAGRVEKKASKIRARTSSVIPTPVSITSSTIHGPSRRVVRISSPPEGMACSALRTRFKRACLNRSASMPDRRQVGRELGADHDPLGRRVRLVEVAELVDDRVQVGRLELQVLDPGEPEEVLEDVVQPMDLVLQPLDPLQHAAVARGLGVLKVLGQQVEVQRDRRERIADLMSQPAGELGDLGVLGAKPAG